MAAYRLHEDVFYPSLLFMIRTNQLMKTDSQSIDDSIRLLIKRTLGLPPNAANDYIYGAREDGLFAVPLTADDPDIAIVEGWGVQVTHL